MIIRALNVLFANFIPQIVINYTDGNQSVIITDNSWDVYKADAFGWLTTEKYVGTPAKAAIIEKYGGMNWSNINTPYKQARSKVPANTSASLTIPSLSIAKVEEGNKPLNVNAHIIANATFKSSIAANYL